MSQAHTEMKTAGAHQLSSIRLTSHKKVVEIRGSDFSRDYNLSHRSFIYPQ